MKSSVMMDFSVDKENRKISISREFAAPLPKVWAAWTESELLDQWWAPKPWQARTKTLDLREGGQWIYAMVGPDGSQHWCRADFTSVLPQRSYSAEVNFCDEQGQIDTSFPRSYWTNTFTEAGGATVVEVVITYDTLADLEKMVEMGFREGFAAAHQNLDELLASQQ